MVEKSKPPLSGSSKPAIAPKTPTRSTSAVKKYTLPIPVKTFPLPTFHPTNPISLCHLAVAWLGQVLFPPAVEPATIYRGIWSSETRSVHVIDAQSMNDLWCQGFFGKGSLSRSEPTWLQRQKAETSERRTAKRREERADSKWERGRTALEAIEQQRWQEIAQTKKGNLCPPSGNGTVNGIVDDLKVDSDQNGEVAEAAEAAEAAKPTKATAAQATPRLSFAPPVGPLQLLALPNSEEDFAKALSAGTPQTNGNGVNGTAENDTSLQDIIINGLPTSANGVVDGETTQEESASQPEPKSKSYGELTNGMNGQSETTLQPMKRRKSVRFSPNVESTVFQLSDPPSPNHASKTLQAENENAASPLSSPLALRLNAPQLNGATKTEDEINDREEAVLQNREHLQLAPEEAFFLAFALGVLTVDDPATNTPLSTERLFTLLRQHSYFPPRPIERLAPDDPFLVHYAVYHHFRSLGWVPRHGLKFGVDWLLYGKGPALDHAEFGVMVMPSYTDPWWKNRGKTGLRRSWHWLHSVNRVLTTVYKSLVLVYVDIPPPSTEGEESAAQLLSRFTIREIMVRRWSANRNRE